MYHGIDEFGNTKYNTRYICVKNFEEQILLFKKKFKIQYLSDLFEERKKSEVPLLSITFDDGFKNNFKYALPILEKYKIPATFFVTALNEVKQPYIWVDLFDILTANYDKTIEFLGVKYKPDKVGRDMLRKVLINYNEINYREKNYFLNTLLTETGNSITDRQDLKDYWELMSDDDIQEVGNSKYVKIGSHGYWHNSLRNMPYENAVKELRDSKKYLEKLVPYKIDSISYPYGRYTRKLLNDAEKLGYKYQLAVRFLYKRDKYDGRIRERYGAEPTISNDQLMQGILNR